MVIVKTKGVKFNKSRNEKIRKVLSAMDALLRELPFSEISITKIMLKADVSRGTMNYYFRGKQEVLSLLVDHLFNEKLWYLLRKTSGTKPQKLPAYYFREITLEMLSLAEEYRHVFKGYREQFYRIEGLKEHYEGQIERIRARLYDVLIFYSNGEAVSEEKAKHRSKAGALLIAAHFWEVVDGRQEEGAAAIAASIVELFTGDCNK